MRCVLTAWMGRLGCLRRSAMGYSYTGAGGGSLCVRHHHVGHGLAALVAGRARVAHTRKVPHRGAATAKLPNSPSLVVYVSESSSAVRCL
jgi:hypothetical protein